MTNVAVIGCGRWGMNYVRLLHELPDVRIVSACDVDPRRRDLVQEKFPLLSVCANVEEIFTSRWIDAVVVVTPAATHFELVKRALLAGKHVLVEKPMTTSVADAEELVELARTQDRTLMVGLTFYYNAGSAKMKTLMSEREFGECYYLHMTRTNLGVVRPDVSVVWDLASHDLAIGEYLLETEPLWVQANGLNVLGNDREDVAFITVGYPGNVIANIHVSWIDPNKVREVVAVGSHRRVVFNDINQGEPIRIYEKGIEARQEADSFGEYRLLMRDGDIISPRVAPSEPLRNEVEHFFACVREGRTPRTDARIGAANVRALAAVETSLALNGRRISLESPAHSLSANSLLEKEEPYVSSNCAR